MANDKAKASTALTGVYEGNISEAKSKPNLALVRTELPKSITDAKYPTGFIAVPKYDVHQPRDSKFASVELHDANKNMSIQYTDVNGARQTAQVSAADLIEVHKEAKAAYRAKQAENVAVKDAPAPSKEAQAEA